MKLLFDQNISFRIIKLIEDTFPDSRHVNELDLDNKTDFEIWEYAKKNGFTIVTFDADFFDIANINGHPPKIIWLRTGNTRTLHVSEILKDESEVIKDFIQNPDHAEIAGLQIERKKTKHNKG